MSVDPELLDWIREAVAEAESREEIRASLQCCTHHALAVA